MISTTSDECLQKMFDSLNEMMIGNVRIDKFKNGDKLYFMFDKKYYGEIIPIRFLLKDKTFNEKFNPINLIYSFKRGKRYIKNKSVCESCKKIKYYPNVYFMTLYCTLDEMFDTNIKKDKVHFTFCKHENMVDFLNKDYNIHNSESSSSISSLLD